MWNRKEIILGLCAAIAALVSAQAQEQWPQRPVTVVVPFGAGGHVDTFPRIVALSKLHSVADAAKLAGTLLDAQVDLNPHQVEAALFAFKSPLSKGAIRADQVGLGNRKGGACG